MGFARNGIVIRDGDPLRVQGVAPAGLAVRGEVIWRPAPPVPAEWKLIAHAAVAGTPSGDNPWTPAIDTTGADLIVTLTASTFAPGVLVEDSFGNTFVFSGIDSGASMHYRSRPIVGPGHQFRNAAYYGPMLVSAWSGSASAPLDQISSWPSSLTAITPSVDGALIIAGYQGNSTPTQIDSGFTITDVIDFIPDVSYSGGMAYLVQPAAATVAPNWGYMNFPSVTNISFKRAS